MLLLQEQDCSFSPQKGQVYWRVSENTADGPLTYQREQKVIPHPGRMQGWAHRSRVWLHDLGHVPCHLSALGVPSALSGVGGQESSQLIPRVVSGQTLALGLLAGVSLPTVLVVGARCIFVWFSFRKSFTVRAHARAGDRYPLAGESSAAGGFPEVGALPSPWPVLPREQSTCLPTDLYAEGMCR